jgi:trimeric autotransporter adhesin
VDGSKFPVARQLKVAGASPGQGAVLDLRQPVGLLLAVCATLALIIVVVTHQIGFRSAAAPPAGRSASTAQPSFSSVPLPARATISSALGTIDPAFRIRTGAGRLSAINAGQHLGARFGRDGATVKAGSSRLGLRLAAVGARRIAPLAPRADRNSVSYAHPNVDESWTNGPLGLEQSFEIARSPTHQASDVLTLSLALSGNLRASLAGDRQSAVFTAPGRTALAYRGLSVTDARGHHLRSWLALDRSLLSIRVDTRGATYPIHVDPYVQYAELTGGTSAEAGYSLAFADNDVVAGAPDANVGGFSDAGEVLVFSKPAGGWGSSPVVPSVLTATAPAQNAKLGSSVAISGDGGTIAAGATGGDSGDGIVFVFTENGNAWTSEQQVARLSAASGSLGDDLGHSVAVSSNGSTIAAGAPGRAGDNGAVLVWDEPGSAWTAKTQTSTLTGDGGALGVSLAISQDGDIVVAGAPAATENGDSGQGAVYVFTDNGGAWSSATLTLASGAASEKLGTSVGLSGSTIVAGAPGFVGSSDDVGQGAAFVFTEPGSSWGSETQTAKLTASNPAQLAVLGESVAVSGTEIVAGAPGVSGSQGAAYVFIEPGTSWTTETQQAELTASDGAGGDSLGDSIALSGSTIAAGAPVATASGNTDQGATYVFLQQGSTTTSVSCSPNPVQSGNATTCQAQVDDTSGDPSPPGGTVSFSTSGAGNFSSNAACSLTSVLKSESASTCSVTYTETDDVSPTITAVYDGDATHPGSRGSTPLTVTKPLDTTSTNVNCGSNTDPSGGTQLSCAASVSDATNGSNTPTGTVNWTESGGGSFNDTSCTLSSGSCSVDFTPTTANETTVTATYAGDSTHNGSSGSETLNGGLPTSLQSSSCPTPIEVGQQETCVAVLTWQEFPINTPSGAITFSSSGAGSWTSDTKDASGETFTGNPCTLTAFSDTYNYGILECVEYYTPTAAGNQVITFSYNGDGTYAPTSYTFPITVTANSTSTGVSCSPNPVSSNQPSTCTATVTDTGANPITPGGSVTFSQSGGSGGFSNTQCALSGSGAVSSCSVTYTQADSGSPSVTATYNPDGAHTGSSNSTPLAIDNNSTTTGISCDPGDPNAGTQTSCTATVTDTGTDPSTPTGTVGFASTVQSGTFTSPGDSCTLATASNTSATCSATYSQPGAGAPTIDATYSGDPAHSAGSPGSETLAVGSDQSDTTVACDPAQPAINQQTTCTVTVTDPDTPPSTPTGSVTFSSSESTGTFTGSGKCTLSAGGTGKATCTVGYSQPTAGSPTITASYPGDAAHIASSGTATPTIPPNPTTITVNCSQKPSSGGLVDACKASVTDTGPSPITPTGSITFATSATTGSFTGNPCTLSGTGASAACTLDYSDSAGGTPKITATYAGDHDHSGGAASTKALISAPPSKAPPPVSTSAPTTSGSTAQVSLTCGTGSTACPVSVTLTAVETLLGNKIIGIAASARKTTKVVVIGSEKVTIGAGQRETLKITLSKTGSQLLTKFHTLHAKLVISEDGKTEHTATLKFKSKAKSRKRR